MSEFENRPIYATAAEPNTRQRYPREPALGLTSNLRCLDGPEDGHTLKCRPCPEAPSEGRRGPSIQFDGFLPMFVELCELALGAVVVGLGLPGAVAVAEGLGVGQGGL